MGNLRLPHHLLGAGWRDCDRARLMDNGVVTSWMGFQRSGMRFSHTTMFGSASNRLDVCAADEEYIRKRTGSVLAVVDRSTNTAGRIMSLGYNGAGLNGSVMVGRPVQTTGTGLSDLYTRGVWAGGALSTSNKGILAIKISTAGTPDQFQYSTDGGTTWQTAANVTGSWQALGATGVEIKFTATTGHTANDAWQFGVGGRPMLLGSINRQGPHNYLEMTGADGKAMIWTPWDRVKTIDRNVMRNAGIKSPKIKGVVSARMTVTDTPSSTTGTELGVFTVGPSSWVAVSSNSTVTEGTATPSPVNGVRYVKLAIPTAVKAGGVDLAYMNDSQTISATVKRIRLYLYGDWTRSYLFEKKFSLVVATAVALGGTRKLLPIRNVITAKKWIQCDLAWDNDGNAFSMASIGLRLENSIPYVGDVWSGGTLDIYMDWITTDGNTSGGAGTTVDSELFDSNDGAQGTFRFCHTWHRSTDNRESAPSPWSDKIELNGTAIKYDAAGYYPGIQAGLKNSAPDDADGLIVYAGCESMGPDPRIGKGLSMRRLTDPIPLTNATDPATLGQIIVDFTNELTKADFENLKDAPLVPFYNDIPAGGDVVIEDGDLLLVAVRPEYSVGTLARTNGSGLVTPVSATAETTPIIGDWMEGQRIWFRGDDRVYRIIKALDTDGDGDYDGLWIGTDFDPDIQEFKTLYQGTTSSSAGYVILGDDKTIRWTNKYSSGAEDQEAMSLLNYLRPMANDGIVGGIKVDEFVYIVGSKGACILRQKDAFADVPYLVQDGNPVAAMASYANAVHLPGITAMGKRLFAHDANGAGYWLGAQGELFVASRGNSVQQHPVTAILSSIIDGYGMITDTMGLRHSWMKYFRRGSEECIFIAVTATSKTPGAGVTVHWEDVYDFGAVESGSEETVIADAGDTYQFAWYSDGPEMRGADSGQGEYEPMPPVHFWPFSPRPWVFNRQDGSADFYRWTDPWGKIIEVRSNFTDNWAAPYDLDQNGDGVVSLEDFPAALAEETGDNPEWPSPGALSPHYHSYTFNESANKCYKFNIKTSAIAGTLFTAQNTFQPGVYTSGGENDPYTNSFIPASATKLGFWVYSDEAVASGKIKIVIEAVASNGGDWEFTITQALTADAWNWVEFDLAANPPSGGYITGSGDNYLEKTTGDPLSGVYWVDMRIDLLSAFATETNIYITGGRLFFNDYESLSTGTPDEPFSEATCIEYGSTYNDEAITRDFETGILIDLKRNAVYTGVECRFTCAMKDLGNSCGHSGQAEGPIFVGSRAGYVNFAFDESLLSWGCPASRFVWGVDSADPGTASTVNVDQTFLGAAGVLSLPLNTDGLGTLAGLIVAKVSIKDSDGNRAIEYKRITTSDSNTITVDTNWTTNPVATDIIVIGPLPATFHPAEVRSKWPILPKTFSADITEDESENTPDTIVALEPHVQVKLFRSSGNDRQSNIFDAPAATVSAVRSDFDDRRGEIGLTPKPGKAVSQSITILGGQTGRVKISNPTIVERVEDGEG